MKRAVILACSRILDGELVARDLAVADLAIHGAAPFMRFRTVDGGASLLRSSMLARSGDRAQWAVPWGRVSLVVR